MQPQNKQNEPYYKPGITNASWAPYWVRGIVAFIVGVLVYQGQMLFLDVHIELFSGMSGFNARWILAMSLVPFLAGIVIGIVYGFGGKYLAHFPPALTMLWVYQHTPLYGLPEGTYLIPWGLWIVFVILQMEFCAIGGLVGEIIIRRHYAWDSEGFQAADSESLPDENEGNVESDISSRS